MTKNQEVEVEYHKNGNKKHERHIKDGELDGVSTSWFEDGTLLCLYHYRNGKPDGVFNGWYKNGNKQYEMRWKDGHPCGVSTWHWFYEDGTKEKEKLIKNDKDFYWFCSKLEKLTIQQFFDGDRHLLGLGSFN